MYPRVSAQQNNNYMAAYSLPPKPFELSENYVLVTAGETGTNLLAGYTGALLHMNRQNLANQQNTYIRLVYAYTRYHVDGLYRKLGDRDG